MLHQIKTELVGGQYFVSYYIYKILEETDVYYKCRLITEMSDQFEVIKLFPKVEEDVLLFDAEKLGFIQWRRHKEEQSIDVQQIQLELDALNNLFDEPEYENTSDKFNQIFFNECDKRLTKIQV